MMHDDSVPNQSITDATKYTAYLDNFSLNLGGHTPLAQARCRTVTRMTAPTSMPDFWAMAREAHCLPIAASDGWVRPSRELRRVLDDHRHRRFSLSGERQRFKWSE